MKKLISSKLFKTIFITLIIVVVSYMGLMYYAFYPREGKKYLFPEEYRGWVCITYEKKGAPPLEIEDDALVLKVPKSGVIETSSRSTIVQAEGYYVPTYSEYYYYSEKGTREASELAMGGGFTVQKEGSKEFTSYFWISTKGNSEKDYKQYVKNRNVSEDPLCGEWIQGKNNED